MHRGAISICAGLCVLFCIQAFGEQAVSFERDIRPLLSASCFQCHGPDPESRKAKLRLDESDSAFGVRDGGPVIVPGDPGASLLLQRVTSTDPGERMPPPEAAEALTEAQVTLLRSWIAQGAPWAKHWAFEAPERRRVPGIPGEAWGRNPIDGFILARMTEAGLKPAPEADRQTLVRRLYLDLTGLPPEPADISDAMNDTRADWYEALVDRLLDSPHFGEHWARHWLDAAQYADSDGFEKDKPRQVWTWRDWVINAFNENKPYDQFVIEQVAGDRLPGATIRQQVATGFLRNSMINEEGGIDPEQFRMEGMFNRMDLIGRAVLGLTVGCAQCHTHKFDPLTHTEYYGMLAFLNDAHEACITVYSEDEEQQRQKIRALILELEDGIKTANPDWKSRMESWAESARALPAPEWEVLEFEFDDSSAGGQKCTPQEDGSYLAQGYAPTRFQPKMTAITSLKQITAVRLELLPDPNLPCGGPGRSIYGTCAISEFELRSAVDDTLIANYDQWTPVKIASAMADVNPPVRPLGPEYPDKGGKTRLTGPVDMAIDGNGDTAWTTDIDPGRRNQARYAIFQLETPLAVTPGMRLAVRLAQNHGGWNSDDNQTNNAGRFRIAVTGADALPPTAIPGALRTILAKDTESWTPEEASSVFSYWRTTVPRFREINGRIDGLWLSHPTGATQLALQARSAPRTTHRLDRGDFLSPAETVEPQTPSFLHPFQPDGAPDRLDFARWLVSPESPTTARAYVNRLWQRYFAHGIVETTADFGMQGAPPSHPELLDWLAVEFMESGWDVKHMHRLIVNSAAYRQHSAVTDALLEQDPANRLLARGARFRVEGETVRDIALAASGLLYEKIGGPSVYPPAPEFLFLPPASYGPKTWNTDQGLEKYRRGLYTFRFRSVPYPALQVFDSPAGDAPCTRRERSNSPLQALTMLNEPLFFETALKLAEKILAEGGATERDRLEFAFRRCVSRAPDEAETETLLAFLEEQRTRFAQGGADPQAILANGGGEAGTADPQALAAWTLTARVLLNLDETITRQ